MFRAKRVRTQVNGCYLNEGWGMREERGRESNERGRTRGGDGGGGRRDSGGGGGAE